jgi:ATPase subunit of ABC transporter with duplicated ATPase domains
MSILDVKELTHSFGDKKLFNNANMQLFRGDKLGLTGLNGAGKSTFIGMLINEVIPDSGYIKWNPKVRIGYLDQHAKVDKDQTVKDYLCEAYKTLFEAEKSLEQLNNEISKCKDGKKLEKLLLQSGTYQELLESNNFYSINSEIEKVAAGLGVSVFGLNTLLLKLSGGQRAKTMLAKLLLEQPDVLLLDEPTNFLDKEHIEWLAKYLNGFDGSFILVSHDFLFLNKVINCICDIEFGTITRFNGNYESFVKQKDQKKIEYIKNYNSQQKEVAKLEEFVAKNSARASTSALANSRKKKLEKIERMEKPNEAPKPTFLFKFKPVVGKTLLKVNNLAIGYTEQLLPSINLELLVGQKLAITGFNGIGKTTFLKTVCGLIPSLSGKYSFADKISIGYYEQESKWENPEFTPLQFMKDLYPTLTDKELRGHLSRCGLKSEHAMQKLSTLSGGEQAKVKLCKLILKPYNVLILDEPTNHLDVNAIEQLKKAIKQFEGSVLFVSHSKQFCSEVADKVLNMESLFD